MSEIQRSLIDRTWQLMTYGCKRGRGQISIRGFCAKGYRVAESLIEVGNSGEGRKILRGKMVDSYQV